MAAIDVPSQKPARIDTPKRGDERLAKLSLNQKTVDEWPLRAVVNACAEHGIPAIGVWRESLAEVGLALADQWVRKAGLRVSSLCRGGFFTVADGSEAQRRHEDNLRALDEAAMLGAPASCLCLAGSPRAIGTWTRRGRGCRKPSRNWCPTQPKSESGSRSSRCTRNSRQTEELFPR